MAIQLGRLLRVVSPYACATLAAGYQVLLDLSDRIQAQMWCNAYESETVALFHALIHPNSTVLDIGAHVGYFSVLAAALVGTSGTVHSFEPDPRNLARLKKNVARYDQVRVWEVALSDEDGISTFYPSPLSAESGWGTLVNTQQNSGTPIPVKTMTLNQWLKSNPLADVSLAKIDAEGSEYRILEGGQRLLEVKRPALLLEARDEWLGMAGRSLDELLEVLRRRRYVAWEVRSSRGRPTGSLLALPGEASELPLPRSAGQFHAMT
jgi:FkbM family methyltransferase